MSTPWVPQKGVPQFGARGLQPLVLGAGVAIAALFIVFSTYFTIDQGERGVILHIGALAGAAPPGLHFKMPIITSIERFPCGFKKNRSRRPPKATPPCRPIRATSSRRRSLSE